MIHERQYNSALYYRMKWFQKNPLPNVNGYLEHFVVFCVVILNANIVHRCIKVPRLSDFSYFYDSTPKE